MKNVRGERLSSQFREEISKVISLDLRNKHPEMSAIISVTDVDVAPDLKSCRAYISIFDVDAEKRKTTFETIVQNAGYVRHALSKVLHIRTIPEVRFILDESMEYGDKIDKLLKNIEDTDEGHD